MQGKAGNNGPALTSTLYFPTDLQIDPTGAYLYFADSKNGEVRRVNFATNVINLVAGTGIAGYTADGIQATASELNTTYGLALDAAGNVFIADTKNYRIRRVDAATGIITTVAGNGTVGTAPGTTLPAPNNGNGGLATAAQLVFAQRLAVDPAGNLLITDSNDYQIRRVDAITGIITQFAGVGIAGSYAAVSNAGSGYIKTPLGIFLDAAGNVYYAETGNNVIRKLSTNTQFPSTAVGVSSASQPLYALMPGADTPQTFQVTPGFADFTAGTVTGCTFGTAATAGTTCSLPFTFSPGLPGVRTAQIKFSSANGTVYTGLTGIGRGALATLQPGVTSTLAGKATAGSTGDGAAASAALLSAPNGVTTDSAGTSSSPTPQTTKCASSPRRPASSTRSPAAAMQALQATAPQQPPHSLTHPPASQSTQPATSTSLTPRTIACASSPRKRASSAPSPAMARQASPETAASPLRHNFPLQRASQSTQPAASTSPTAATTASAKSPRSPASSPPLPGAPPLATVATARQPPPLN